MADKIDIARALKDKDYFNSLTPEEQEQVRQAGGVGASDITDSDLDTVSGGLEGGEVALATTTTGRPQCPVCPPSTEATVCVC